MGSSSSKQEVFVQRRGGRGGKYTLYRTEPSQHVSSTKHYRHSEHKPTQAGPHRHTKAVKPAQHTRSTKFSTAANYHKDNNRRSGTRDPQTRTNFSARSPYSENVNPGMQFSAASPYEPSSIHTTRVTQFSARSPYPNDIYTGKQFSTAAPYDSRNRAHAHATRFSARSPYIP